MNTINHTLRSPLIRQMMLVFSLSGILLVTIISYFEIKGDHEAYHQAVINQLNEIGPVYLKPLTEATWATNEKEMKLLLDSITWHTRIEYAAITDNGIVIAKSGHIQSKDRVEKRFPMIFSQQGKSYTLGSLDVVGGMDIGRNNIWNNIKRTVLYWTAMIAAFTTILYLLIHRSIIRHILRVSQHIRELDIRNTKSLLTLARKPRDIADELDELANAINEMHAYNRNILSTLNQKENEIRLLLDSTEEGIYGVNNQGICIFANFSAIFSLGYESEHELVGKNIHEMIHHSHEDGTALPATDCQILKSITTGKSAKADNEFFWRKDGSHFPVEYRSRPLIIYNRISGAVVTFNDISEQKRAEAERQDLQRQLTQAQKMESIGHLTGGIAHDFNNMLGAMLGYTELLKHLSSSNKAIPDKFEKYLNEIYTAGNRAKELISQMMVFSRVNPQTRDENIPIVMLQPVIREIENLLRSTLPSNISIEYDLPDEVLWARIHPVQLHQVIINLAINAKDAIQGYGEISVRISSTHAAGECHSCHTKFDDEYLEICLQDSGDGIPDDVIDKLFDPFFTTKEVGKGTGMGLPVVHGIVHACNGHVMVKSEMGKGTTVCVLLPVVDDTQELTAEVDIPDRTDAEQLAGMQIMLVDDDESIVEMLTEILQLHGAIVHPYTDSLEATNAFSVQPEDFDLIVSDEIMPKITGFDLAKAAIRLNPGIPVILLTGYSERVTSDIALQNGIAGFMYKPIKVDAFLRLILKVTPKFSRTG